MRNWLRTVRKAVGALLGAATGVAVIQVLDLFGVTVDVNLANATAVLLAAAGAWIAPKNAEASDG